MPDTLEHIEVDDFAPLVQADAHLPSLRHAVRDLRARVVWDDRHDRLAAHPLMAGLRRSEIRRWARAAEEVEFDAGEALLHQNGMGYWFILLLSGSATRCRDGALIDVVGAGDHLGEMAIFGGRPQPATVTATSPVRAFVVGRQRVACLVHDQKVVQERLFPDARGQDFVSFVRRLRAGAAAEWRLVGPPPRPAPGRRSTLHLQIARPGRPVARDPGFAAIGRGSVRPAPSTPVPLGWRARLGLGLAAALAIVLCGLRYHPPMLVISAVHPIDVSQDVVVTGVPTHPVHGRYLLLAVRFDRPNAFGAALALLTHRHRMGIGGQAPSAADRSEARRLAEAVFRQSEQDAAAAAARIAGLPLQLHGTGAVVASVLDPTAASGIRVGDVIVAVGGVPVHVASDAGVLSGAWTVERSGRRFTVRGVAHSALMFATRDPSYTLPFRVTFRHRAIGGPSGGLVYALALADMITGRDLADGRVIAATGAIDPTGSVAPIGFAADKCSSAHRAAATVVFVPRGAAVGSCGSADAVFDLWEAVHVLRP